MASASRSKAALAGHGHLAAGAPDPGPPPSTAAAELLHNISAPARYSGHDENGELKRFFLVIEQVKNDPSLLKTSEQRVEHNHMLIYVYTRVALDTVNIDGPNAHRGRLRADAVKAINLYRLTIKETPAALLCTGDAGGFLFQGREPLWAWLFPRVLQFLGHAKCDGLTSDIEHFFQFILDVTTKSNALCSLATSMTVYLQEICDILVRSLQEQKISAKPRDTSVILDLPPSNPLSAPDVDGSTYTIRDIAQVARQAHSLVVVLTRHLAQPWGAVLPPSPPSEYVIWVLDAVLDLEAALSRWHNVASWSRFRLMSAILDVIACGQRRVDLMHLRKARIALLLLAGKEAGQPHTLVDKGRKGVRSRRTYCWTLLFLASRTATDRKTRRLVATQIIRPLEILAKEEVVLGVGTDVWRCLHVLKHTCTPGALSSLEADFHPSKFADDDLGRQVSQLRLPYDAHGSGEHDSKRRKLFSEPDLQLNRLLCLIYDLAENIELDDDVSDFQNDFLAIFPQVSEKSQCDAIELLSRRCCAQDGTLIPDAAYPWKPSNLRCSWCDLNKAPPPRGFQEGASVRNTQEIFSELLNKPYFASSRRPRIIAMIALRRLALHTRDPAFFDLISPGPGQWCLSSLQSSLRELRITAGRTLGVFLHDGGSDVISADIITRNRLNSISVLKAVSERELRHLDETCTMAWGQIGRFVSDSELNLVVAKLLEYLRSSSLLVSACAFNEITKLAECRGITPRRLFEPYWRNLAYSAIKDLVSHPHKTRSVADILRISVRELLLLTQTHALPWLVLANKKDVIQKITEARNEENSWQTIWDSANIGSILALLFIQDVADIEAFIMSRLADVSPHFLGLKLSELILSDSTSIALELLKTAGDSDDLERKSKARRALKLVAGMHFEKEPRNRQRNVLGRFLNSQALGMMARLTDVINDTLEVSWPTEERRRCIQAVEEMIVAAREYSQIVRPQICACLLATLPQEELREAAFSCWVAMLHHMEDNLAVLLDTTFFIITHYWRSFTEASRRVAEDMLAFLLKNSRPILESKIDQLPSLGHIPRLLLIESQLDKLRRPLESHEALELFALRLSHEHSGVVFQALQELSDYLKANQDAILASAISEQPDAVVAHLLRAVLDCAAKYNGVQVDIGRLSAECLGLIGCIDPNRLETVREQRSFIALHSFQQPEEVTDFVLFILEEVLVKSFLSATDTRLQGFLSYAMQELLDRCEVREACATEGHGSAMRGTGGDIYRKWLALSETAREVLTPFLNSRFCINPMALNPIEYPIYRPGKMYGNWIKSLVLDLLRKGQHPTAELIFEPLRRVIRVKDVSIAEALLPYLFVHVIVGDKSTDAERESLVGELINILENQPTEKTSLAEREEMKVFCGAVFRVLDHAMQWLQAKRSRTSLDHHRRKDDETTDRLQDAIDMIPAQLISRRAVDCKEYARALFHLEQHAREIQQEAQDPADEDRILAQLQDIYTHIDDPDGLDGISAQLHVLDINQQILSHRKAGRWDATQSWYEIQLAENPDNMEIQVDLLTCLKQSGQHDVLLNYVEGMHADPIAVNRIVPFAVEAAWATGRWETMQKFKDRFKGNVFDDFDVGLAFLFDSIRKGQLPATFNETVRSMRDKLAAAMTFSATSSLSACHDIMLRAHVIADLDILASVQKPEGEQHNMALALLDRRLEVLGAFVNDKQYLLGIRRAAMQLLKPKFNNLDISYLWLATARLARKVNAKHQSFSAVLHASQLGDKSATIENARLLWKDGHMRKAIHLLQSAIDNNVFASGSNSSVNTLSSTKSTDSPHKMLLARAQLKLAKWLDESGQTNATALMAKYQQPPKTFPNWEKGHYYMGLYYKTLLESEKAFDPDNEQSDHCVTFQYHRLIVENYIRSLTYGTKYLYQTLPRALTLWLEMGSQAGKSADGKASVSRELYNRRIEQLNKLHEFLDKRIQRLPAYVFYSTLPQITARLAHPTSTVFERLSFIVIRVIQHYPQQALWSLLGVLTSRTESERRTRGKQILQTLKNVSQKVGDGSWTLKSIISKGEQMAEQLVAACQHGKFPANKSVTASITRDLRFNHKCTPCPLVVPIESCLTATLPTLADKTKKDYHAFSRGVITIESFDDEVLVLGSLAKPRRLTAIGSDGRRYKLLVKPKDDLRTDQRLMEFNSLINRALKKDAESSRRQLYIRTYAVTPLNEECGIIEWVDGLMTLRDILLPLYQARGIYPEYNRIKEMLDRPLTDATTHIFTKDVLGMFPEVMPLWFVKQFPSPSAWFSARLRYTRSCAVMSMVGTILGLGDRHTENILLEEGNGGVFHVDFNCLFDKGRTFERPEKVPFRLTHNMVAAMGIYGYEGPFRKCSELTLAMLRQQEETLMTVLEAFIYDPTLDLQNRKKRNDAGVKLQPQAVVGAIKKKMGGYVQDFGGGGANQYIPLGVEGQAEELIRAAVDPKNLAAMYVGWCPFL